MDELRFVCPIVSIEGESLEKVEAGVLDVMGAGSGLGC